MSIPYRTRRTLQHFGTAAIALLAAGILFWFCWVIWLERYVVYTRAGAELRFDQPDSALPVEVAVPPSVKTNITIYYNEGSDAMDLSKEMTSINGYYIDYNSLSKDLPSVQEDIAKLKPGSTVMIELKGGYGSFYYSSNLTGAVTSASVETTAVDQLIKDMKAKGFYLIARVSAFRDYDFGNRNVPSGLYMKNRMGLWMDPGGCYWLNPADSTALGWITSFTLELRSMGFNEVMLDNFRFPAETDKYIFNGDMDATLTAAANTLMASCASDTFVLSFGVTNPAFPLPEGRSRLYLSNVSAADLGLKLSQVTVDDPEIQVVFLCEQNDTRFNSYSVLRPLSLAEGIEAQKADMADLED